MTSTFENFRRREMGVMNSLLGDVSITTELTVLLCWVVGGRFILYFFLRRYLKSMEAKYTEKDVKAINENED